jgi:hypothetical protein
MDQSLGETEPRVYEGVERYADQTERAETMIASLVSGRVMTEQDVAELLEQALMLGLPLDQGSTLEDLTVLELDALINAVSDNPPIREIFLYVSHGGTC